jgi:starch phosphorylase
VRAARFFHWAFTIGFRGASHLQTCHADLPGSWRLKKILTNRNAGSVIIAGKAHPKDDPGKRFIRDIVQITRDPDFAQRRFH